MMQHIRSSFMNEFIGSDTQEPNQLLAQKGSRDGSLATLDLSEASDRVSLQLVEELLARNPLAKEAILACRSLRASVPGHETITLAKFASMGSALCFPIEAMVFITITFLAIEREQGCRFTHKRDFLPFMGRVPSMGMIL
uniref:RNA-directed RNA polymerase n=1 Tax=Leviviridae sp. TaxID=2027243 RepID=A0A514CZI3_9VIRU|nr:MAG: RNA-dependent RNA polymerase [Leviviridae sp.]